MKVTNQTVEMEVGDIVTLVMPNGQTVSVISGGVSAKTSICLTHSDVSDMTISYELTETLFLKQAGIDVT